MGWLAMAAMLVLGGTAGAQDEDLGVPVVGMIVWPGADLSHAAIKVFQDAGLRKLVDEFPAAEEGGLAVLALPPGTYYLMAVVDANGNNQLDAGDGVGFYGVTDLTDPQQRPQPYVVRGNATDAPAVSIPIVAVRDEAGKLRAIAATVTAPPPVEGGSEGPPEPGTPPEEGLIGGRVTRPADLTCPLFVLLVPSEGAGEPLAAPIGTDDSFALVPSPGKYRLYVVGDANGNRRLDAGDPVGMYGVDDWAQVAEPLPVLAIAAGAGAQGLRVDVAGVLGEGDGVLPRGATAEQPPAAARLALGDLPALMAGRVAIPEGNEAAATVLVFRDVGLTQLVARAVCAPDGGYALAVPPGTCYLMAALDTVADGRIGPGDTIGFYGIEAAEPNAAPPPVTLGPAGLRSDLDIALTMQIGTPEPPQAAGTGAPGGAAE